MRVHNKQYATIKSYPINILINNMNPHVKWGHSNILYTIQDERIEVTIQELNIPDFFIVFDLPETIQYFEHEKILEFIQKSLLTDLGIFIDYT